VGIAALRPALLEHPWCEGMLQGALDHRR